MPSRISGVEVIQGDSEAIELACASIGAEWKITHVEHLHTKRGRTYHRALDSSDYYDLHTVLVVYEAPNV